MVDKRRIYTHKPISETPSRIIYRMSRDQRVADNWALIYARELAEEFQIPLAVVFTLTPTYPLANFRHYDFMIRGLQEVERNLALLNIPFFLLVDKEPSKTLKNFIHHNNVSIVVSDFDPLRIKRRWIDELNRIDRIAHFEVDAHNIVPCRAASSKAEFAAYTIRPKIKKLLPEMLTEFPALAAQNIVWSNNHPVIQWNDIYKLLIADSHVPPVDWIVPGEQAGLQLLSSFISDKLEGYDSKRNNPNLKWQSNLSPYLHFGQLSAQRVALETVRLHPDTADSNAFLEELIIRRELSDNFCFYNPDYDSPNGFPEWVKKDMEQHCSDERDYSYTIDQLENAGTHDPLWNAAQKELTSGGKMHGYMRMYWAKKILEWTPSLEVAMQNAIYLNDKYSLDGRDPNGYAGIAWSIGGVHDRAWFPRPIFGKIRYMSYNGCKSKFDIDAYINGNLI